MALRHDIFDNPDRLGDLLIKNGFTKGEGASSTENLEAAKAFVEAIKEPLKGLKKKLGEKTIALLDNTALREHEVSHGIYGVKTTTNSLDTLVAGLVAYSNQPEGLSNFLYKDYPVLARTELQEAEKQIKTQIDKTFADVARTDATEEPLKTEQARYKAAIETGLITSEEIDFAKQDALKKQIASFSDYRDKKPAVVEPKTVANYVSVLADRKTEEIDSYFGITDEDLKEGFLDPEKKERLEKLQKALPAGNENKQPLFKELTLLSDERKENINKIIASLKDNPETLKLMADEAQKHEAKKTEQSPPESRLTKDERIKAVGAFILKGFGIEGTDEYKNLDQLLLDKEKDSINAFLDKAKEGEGKDFAQLKGETKTAINNYQSSISHSRIQPNRETAIKGLNVLLHDEKFLELAEKIKKEIEDRKKAAAKEAEEAAAKAAAQQGNDGKPVISLTKKDESVEPPTIRGGVKEETQGSLLVNKYKDLEIAWNRAPNKEEIEALEAALGKGNFQIKQVKNGDKTEYVVGGLTEEMAAKVALLLADKGINAKDASPNMIVSQRMPDVHSNVVGKITEQSKVSAYMAGQKQLFNEKLKDDKAEVIPVQYSGQSAAGQETDSQIQALTQTAVRPALPPAKPVSGRTSETSKRKVGRVIEEEPAIIPEQIAAQALSAGGEVQKSTIDNFGGTATVSNEMGVTKVTLEKADLERIQEERATPFDKMNPEQKKQAAYETLKSNGITGTDIKPEKVGGIWGVGSKPTGNYTYEHVVKNEKGALEKVKGVLTPEEVQAFLDRENAEAAKIPVRPPAVEAPAALTRRPNVSTRDGTAVPPNEDKRAEAQRAAAAAVDPGAGSLAGIDGNITTTTPSAALRRAEAQPPAAAPKPPAKNPVGRT